MATTRKQLLSLYRLSFTSPQLERAFRSDFARRIRLQSRVALLLGAFLVLALGFQDLWFFTDDLRQIWLIRAVMAFTLIVGFVLTFSPRFGQIDQALLLSQFLIAGGGVLLMLDRGSLETANSYYFGFMLVIVWAYSFSGLRFYSALTGNVLLLAGYVIVVGLIKQAPGKWLFTNTANLVAGSAIVAFAGYLIEWQRRVLFHQTLRLDEERRSHEQLALYDQLTGLPNRLLFEKRLAAALRRAQHRGTQLAVLFLDVDHFKPINDSFGHHAGDAVLSVLAARIRACLRHQDTVARIGGDEFLMLIEDIRDRDDVTGIVHKILESAQKPFSVRDEHRAGHKARLSCSIGVALYPADAVSAPILIQCADSAMYAVKREGRNSYRFHAIASSG